MRRAVLLLLPCAVLADEKEAEWIAHNIAMPLRSGDNGVVSLERSCTDDELRVVAPYPKYVLQICAAVNKNLPERPRAKTWKRVVDFAVRLSEASLQLHPKDERVKEAVGDARLARGRYAGRLEDYARAAKFLEPIWTRRKDEDTLRRLIDAVLGTRDFARANELAEAGESAFPKSLVLKTARLRCRLALVRSLLERSPHKGLQELQTVLGEGRALAERAESVARLYNRAVTLGRRYNIAARYITRPRRAVEDRLAFDLPTGTWTPLEDRLEGERTTIELMLEGQQSPKRFARERLQILEQRLRDPKRLVKTRTASLNAHVKKALYFELGGLDKRGEYVRYRCWYFRGTDATYGVEAAKTGAGADLEADLVLASLRISPGR